MMCRRILLTVAVAAILAGTAFSQPPGGGQRQRRGGGAGAQPPGGGRGMQGGFGGGGMALLADKGIQTELKMTEEQVKNVDALRTKQREEMRDLFQPGQPPSDESRQKMQEMGKKYNDELNKILNEEQQKRLKQLNLQNTQKNMGWGALAANPDVAKALEFTDEQKESMKAINDDMMAAMREMRGGGGGGGGGGGLSDEQRAKMTEMRKTTNEKIEKLLTDAQKAKLKDLMGEAYKGEFPRPGRRGGGN